jgi:pilus assembly protein Flp/PilA
MKNLYNGIRKFAKDEEGATAVEYGMMVGLVAVAIIVAVAAIGTQLNVLFTKIKTCITNAAACT